MNKNVVLAGDFNLTVLDCEKKTKTERYKLHKPYVSLWYDTNIKKPIVVTTNTATVINHIITNVIINLI